MNIFCKFPTVNISKLNFWLVICIAKNFIWYNFKGDFLNGKIIFIYIYIYYIYFTYLFSFQIMYKSQFRKIDPYDWFCGPVSHIRI